MLSQWLNKRKNLTLVGLDLGADTIKVVEINTTTSPYKIEKFAMASFPAEAIVKGEIKNVALISQTIKEAFRTANIQNKNIAFSIPRSSTVIKNVKVDSRLTTSEIESRAWIEANNQFPDLVGEIYLDFSLDEATREGSNVELMLVACRKDQLQPYLETFRESNLTPLVIDVNSFALERALSIITTGLGDLSTIALVNIDAALTTLLVSHNKHLIYAHDHNYDGRRLTSQTNDYLKNTAEKVATLNDAGYSDLLKNVLAAHLRHTMHFFYSSRPNVSIQKLILSGDCATTPCLAEFIQQEIGVETIVANPADYMLISSAVDEKELHKNLPALMLAIGLALSEST